MGFCKGLVSILSTNVTCHLDSHLHSLYCSLTVFCQFKSFLVNMEDFVVEYWCSLVIKEINVGASGSNLSFALTSLELG